MPIKALLGDSGSMIFHTGILRLKGSLVRVSCVEGQNHNIAPS